MKEETINQLEIRRAQFLTSLQYAGIKIKALGESDNPTVTNQIGEFKNMQANCMDEIKKIDSCLTWVKSIK